MIRAIKINGSKPIYVFKICESDAVAAHNLDDAIEWYQDLTGALDDELYDYDDVETLELKKEVSTAEDDPTPITIREILIENWKGKPFIAVTSYC